MTLSSEFKTNNILKLVDTLITNKEEALQALKNNIANIKYCSQELLDNKDIALFLAKHGSSTAWEIQYLSERLRNDQEVMTIAIQNSGFSFEYAGEEIKNNRDMVKFAVQYSPYALGHAAKKFRHDKEIVYLALKTSFVAYDYASEEIQKILFKENVLDRAETLYKIIEKEKFAQSIPQKDNNKRIKI